MVQSMLSLADIDEISSNPTKCLCDHKIRKSEDRDRRIATVLKEDFVNPFSDKNKRNLYNLASRHPLPEEATEHLLSLEKQGLLGDFSERLHLSEEQTSAFFDPISRVSWKGFRSAKKKAKITAKEKTKDVAVQRDILGLLMAVSSKEGAVVDLDKALSYALSPVPLALATSDGIRRQPDKSKLMDAALSSVITDNVNTDHATSLVINLIATIRCIAKVPNTFREIALQLLHQIPSTYQTVYAACDTYLERSIKSSKREIRGQAETFVI